MRDPGCHCGRNCQLLIQEFAVNVDQGFLMAIIALFSSGEASEEQTTTEFRRDCGMVDQSLMEDTSQMVSTGVQNYFDHLECSPIKVCLDRVLSHWARFTARRFIFVYVLLHACRWRGGVTVRHLGLRSVGRGFKSCSRQRCVSTLGKLFTPMCLCHQAV